MIIEEQNPRIIALEKENEALKKQVLALLEKIAELEKRLGLNSQNSSKPPSTDGFKTPPRTQSLRTKSGKKSGGQLGNKGYTLLPVSKPDNIIEHEAPHSCEKCGCDVREEKVISVIKRQVFDIPEPKIEVTEHQVFVKQCPHCREKIPGIFPEEVKAPVQYSPRIRAISAYLNNQHFIPEDRLSELMSDLFDCRMSAKTIANINQSCGMELTPIVENIRTKIEKASVKNLDETGVKINGKTNWWHVVSTELMTWYRWSQKRKDNEPLSGLEGTIIHDHWKSYYQLGKVNHGLCNAHHLRELKALTEIDQESWAKSMAKLLLLANKYKHRYESVIPKTIKERLRQIYHSIVSRGIEYHESLPPLTKKSNRGRIKRRVGHNLLIRLRDYEEDVLRFMEEEEVPFTNNQAERDLRMMKCKQKISGGFRSNESAKNFALIRSVISTARKQGENILEILIKAFKGETIVFD